MIQTNPKYHSRVKIGTNAKTLSKASKIFMMVGVGVYIVLRLWHLTRYSLYGGETFIIDGVRLSWTGMMNYIINDIVHPPFYYILARFWIMFNEQSLLWLKLLPFLAAIIAIVPFILLCKELNLRNEEINLALILIAVNSYLVHYAQEFRMYSLFMCLSVFSFWLFVRFYKAENRQGRKLIALSVVNLLLIYTHYFGWLLIGLEFIFLLIWQRKKLLLFSASAVLLLLLFSPWAYFVIRSTIQKEGLSSNLDWIPKPPEY